MCFDFFINHKYAIMDNTYYLHKNYKNVRTMLLIFNMNKKLRLLGKNKFLILMGVENSL